MEQRHVFILTTVGMIRGLVLRETEDRFDVLVNGVRRQIFRGDIRTIVSV